MNRRQLIQGAAALGVLGMVPMMGTASQPSFQRFHEFGINGTDLERLDRAARQWREVLDEDAWRILFREETERPFSSPLDEEYREGTFICAACYLPLFSSATKFDSRTGWPSFYAPFDGHMDTKLDLKMIWPRTEYHCKRCGGHQGHVFNDGPDPTGERWCNNGLALRFVHADDELPALRG